MPRESLILPVERVTEGPLHHFFGYYDKCCWNCSGRYILAQENAFMDRDPDSRDELTIGIIDSVENNRFIALTKTVAWNWQQGCMLRWFPLDNEYVFMYNDFRDGRYVCTLYDIRSGKKEDLPWSVYDIASDGNTGVTGNFARVNTTRPGYGYACTPDPFAEEKSPADDGLFALDIASKQSRLIFSLKDALQIGSIAPDHESKAWFNAMTFNPGGSRFLVLHRWASHVVPGHTGFKTRMLTMNIDGSSPAVLLEGIKISHFTWMDDERIMVWLEGPERGIFGYYIVRDPSGELEPVGEGLFESDGHCNLSPDKRWIVTDRYPQDSPEQPLILFEMETRRRVDIGKFKSITNMNTSHRCDLHTRWDHDGTKLCFDSTHEDSRQMYVVDVGSITAAGMNL